MIQRTHGGAVLFEDSEDANIFVRIEKNAEDKLHSASLAVDHLPPFSTVFIDNSSTCLALADRIPLQIKTVVTNGCQRAMMLSKKKDVKVIFLGGVVQYASLSTDGPLATNMLEGFQMDLMLSGCASLQLDGAYESTIETMQIKKSAYERSKRHILIADRTKFTIQPPYRYAPLEGFDAIYTNARDNQIEPFLKKGIKMINRNR